MGDIIKDNTQEAMISASMDPTALEGPVFSEYATPSVGDSSVPDSPGRKLGQTTTLVWKPVLSRRVVCVEYT